MAQFKFKKKFDWKILFLLPLPLLWIWLDKDDRLKFADNIFLDLRFRARGEIDAPVRVTYVDIDTQAIEELGGFPWPRSYFSEVCSALVEEGHIKGAGVDLVFSEKGVSESYDHLRWADANLQFTRYLRKNPRLVVAASYSAEHRDAKGQWVANELPKLTDKLPSLEDIPLPELPEFNIGRGLMWTPQRVGLIDTLDGGMRWVPMFVPTSINSIKRFDHMALGLAALYWGVDPATFRFTRDSIVVPGPRGNILATIPLVKQQLVEVNWFSPWRSPRNPRIGFSVVYNYARMLHTGDDKAKATAREFFKQFSDAIVLVGPVDKLLQDLAATPFDEVPVPKVSVHGNLLKTLVSGYYLTRFSDGVLYAITLGLTLVVTAFATAGGSRSMYSKAAAFLLLAGYVWLCFYLFKIDQLVLPMAAPLGSALTTAFVGVIWQLVIEEKQKGRIKNMFGTYLAPELVNQMVESQTDPQLGGHEEVVTAYFSDIQEFSTFSEVMTPKELVELMNEYLTACTDLLQEEKGLLDKYIGDAVVFMFGAPLPLADHAYRACVATVRVQKKIDELREKWKTEVNSEGNKWHEKVHKFRARLGLNTGRVIVGNMGSATRFSYTMMGDNVNLAARMESGAKSWGAFTMVTEATKRECERHGGDRVVFRPLGKIMVVGRSIPVKIFEITGLKDAVTSQTRECLRLFAEAQNRYYARDWDGAITLFEQSAALEPLVVGVAPGVKANPSTVYLKICREYKTHPPGENWDGVYVMSEK